jgi:hypothetical protein
MKYIAKFKLIYSIFIILFGMKIAEAQSISVEVDDTEIRLSDVIKLTFSLENVQGSFEPPTFADFRVVNGPFSSTSMQIINGKVSSTALYTYLISPKKEGELYIEEAYVKLQDTMINSAPVKITVSSASSPKKEQWSKKFEYKSDVSKEEGATNLQPKRKRKILKF